MQHLLNIDTDDGNAVSYANPDFWDSQSALGSATDDEGDALTRNCKTLEVYNTGRETEVLMVVHDEKVRCLVDAVGEQPEVTHLFMITSPFPIRATEADLPLPTRCAWRMRPSMLRQVHLILMSRS